MANDADLDRQACELYDARRHCPNCRKAVSLADELQGVCPNCGALLLAGPNVDAPAMLATLEARRAALGLEVRHA